MESVKTMLNLSKRDILKIAKGYNKFWNGKVNITKNTLDNSVAGLVAEVSVAKLLTEFGATELKMYGVDSFISTAKYKKNCQHRHKPDLMCVLNGVSFSIEIKSGFPDRYPHRQFTLADNSRWLERGVDIVVWVDIRDNKAIRFIALTPIAISKLPLKFNNRNKLCHTFSGGYGGYGE